MIQTKSKKSKNVTASQTGSVRKENNAVTAYLAGVISASAIMVWSVFNLWMNVLEYGASGTEDNAWDLTVLLIIATCVVPFVLGVRMLIKTLTSQNRN